MEVPLREDPSCRRRRPEEDPRLLQRRGESRLRRVLLRSRRPIQGGDPRLSAKENVVSRRRSDDPQKVCRIN